MTVSAEFTPARFTADGVLTAFDFGFKIFDTSELVVIVRDGVTGIETQMSSGTDYSVSSVNNDYSAGGTVTFTAAPSDDDIVVITRLLEFKQPEDFDYNDDFEATKVEGGFDRTCMLIQQVNELTQRTVTVPVSDGINGIELPNSISRASKFLAFDSAGRPIASGGTVPGSVAVSLYSESLLSAADAAAARTTLELGAAALKGFKDEDNMASNAADSVPSQQSVKAYVDALIAAISPIIGEIKMWTKAAAPTGWLICDGSAVGRTTYAGLFAAISTTFGVGNGSTTFNLPDLRGRVPMGVGTGDAADATAHALASKAGTEQHTLTVNEMPDHSHNIDIRGAFTSGEVSISSNSGAGTDVFATRGSGGGIAHNNIQPSLAVNFIIKY